MLMIFGNTMIQGSSSLLYAKMFQDELESYCIQKCAEAVMLKLNDPVGCSCAVEPGHTTLPTVVFLVRTLVLNANCL